jgi:hypothetical protein
VVKEQCYRPNKRPLILSCGRYQKRNYGKHPRP